MKTFEVAFGATLALFAVAGAASAQTCAVNTYPCPEASVYHGGTAQGSVVANTQGFPDDPPISVIPDPVDPDAEPNGAGSGDGGGGDADAE